MKRHIMHILIFIMVIVFSFILSVFGVFDEFSDTSVNGNVLLTQIESEYKTIQKTDYPEKVIHWNIMEYYDFPYWCIGRNSEPAGMFVHLKTSRGTIIGYETNKGEVLVAAESYIKKNSRTCRLFKFSKTSKPVILDVTKVVQTWDINNKMTTEK